MSNSKPTLEFYGLLQKAYDFFNEKLFSGKISPCMITLQRNKNTMGYFSENRWVNNDGDKTHEIALNPAYFGNHAVIEIFQTLVHEMCHLYQHDHGNPGRKGYHNAEWANLMESIGLNPSDTGFEGGKRTGQKMSDYPAPGGKFIRATSEFVKQHGQAMWIDRYPTITKACQLRTPVSWSKDMLEGESGVLDVLRASVAELIPDIIEPEQHPEMQIKARKKQKVRYSCPHCHTNIWGKPNLLLTCGVCESPYQVADET